MKNWLVLDTQIVIDLIDKKAPLGESLRILKFVEEKDAIIGLTIFSFYELFKKVEKDNDYYRINHFLATGTDFILSDKRIDSSGILNPEKWDKGFNENTFEYERFRNSISDLRRNVKNYYIDQMTCFITSIVGINIFIKGIIGDIDKRFFKFFVVLENDKSVTPSRSDLVKSIITSEFNKYEFYDKEKSKDVIDSIVEKSMAVITNGTCVGKSAFLHKGDINKAIRSQQNILTKLRHILDLSSSEKFVDSFFKHLNRINEDSITMRGLNLLFDKYIFGRRVSINDFVDLSNIDSISYSDSGNTIYYATREDFWNKQFINDYAKGLENLSNCHIIDF